MPADTTSHGVDAAEIVGVILRALLDMPRPARLKELEATTGIASAKLHRYLVSMVRCGLISRPEGGNRYDLGLLAYRLGQVAMHDHSVLSLLEPMLEKFVAQLVDPDLGQAMGIGQWLGHGATMVRWFESNSPLWIRMKPGASLSVTGSATAKLLAAYLPRDTTLPLVRQELADKGIGSDKEIKKVYAEYEAIRKTGIASSQGAKQIGLNALSAPLFDQSGTVIAALTILGMAPHFDADPASPAAHLLLRLSRDLSEQMGYRPRH